MCFFFFQAEDGIRDKLVTGVQTCALPISNVPLRHIGFADTKLSLILSQQLSTSNRGKSDQHEIQHGVFSVPHQLGARHAENRSPHNRGQAGCQKRPTPGVSRKAKRSEYSYHEHAQAEQVKSNTDNPCLYCKIEGLVVDKPRAQISLNEVVFTGGQNAVVLTGKSSAKRCLLKCRPCVDDIVIVKSYVALFTSNQLWPFGDL